MGRHKRKSIKQYSKCTICNNSYSTSSSVIPRCSVDSLSCHNTICDSCLHKHILNSISKSFINPVFCPGLACRAKLNEITIRKALVPFGYQSLWDDYVLRSNWSGTSKEWIEHFAVKCPCCRVPIEKNGGCDYMVCRQCALHFNWMQAKTGNYHTIKICIRFCFCPITLLLILNKMNPYGGNPFTGNSPFQYPGSFPQQDFGQFGNNGGYFNGLGSFPTGNAHQGSFPFSLNPPTPGFRQTPFNNQFGQGFNFPPASGGSDAYQQSPYMPQFPRASQPPYTPRFPAVSQPSYVPSFPLEQNQFGGSNYFGSGAYGRNRSRRSSRHRSKPRHRSTSSSSSSDDNRRRGSPFDVADNAFGNVSSYQNMQPRIGSPLLSPRLRDW
ncbi:unnamed protein product [Rotaria socialis]|uniref:RING-type domain-containing protein n=3 Tax=Rotaria socialis TaxID=392032 RepID=A0A817YMP9_9BILA|nr:unnamed protein product [Rotaria socialis]CAF3450948.1 unnamed protein product [Rotaria socialis]